MTTFCAIHSLIDVYVYVHVASAGNSMMKLLERYLLLSSRLALKKAD